MLISASEERFEMAIELCELAESLLREKIRRTRPSLSPAEVEAEIDAWFMQRRGAEQGDAEGHPVPWPRVRS
jgi:hypothetical protein